VPGAGDCRRLGGGTIMQYASGPSQPSLDCPVAPTALPGGIRGTGINDNQKPNRCCQDCRAHGGASMSGSTECLHVDGYQLGTFGNSGVGSCTGPGSPTPISLYKTQGTERVDSVRMEFYNVFTKPSSCDQNGFQLANGNALACRRQHWGANR